MGAVRVTVTAELLDYKNRPISTVTLTKVGHPSGRPAVGATIIELSNKLTDQVAKSSVENIYIVDGGGHD